MYIRLTEKERMSQELGFIFQNLRRKTRQSIDDISGLVRVSTFELRQIDEGRANTVGRLVLLKVFEFFPISNEEEKGRIAEIIALVGRPECRKVRYVHHYSQR